MPSLNLASLAFAFLPLAAVGCAVAPDDAAIGDDDAVSTEDAVKAAQRAEKQGAPLSAAGFTDSTELRFVCQACNCPRGDTAVALSKDAASAHKLENLGWQRVEN